MPIIDIDMVSPGFINNQPSDPRREGGKTPYSLVPAGHERPLSDAEVAHVKKLKRLQESFDVHPSRSLDHYFHQELTDEQLQELNSEQVLSRFLYYQQKIRQGLNTEKSQRHDEVPEGITSFLGRLWARLRGPRVDTRTRDGSQFESITRLEEQKPVCERDGVKKDESVTRGDREICKGIAPPRGASLEHEDCQPPRQQILVVSQFWLWRIDGVFGDFQMAPPPYHPPSPSSMRAPIRICGVNSC